MKSANVFFIVEQILKGGLIVYFKYSVVYLFPEWYKRAIAFEGAILFGHARYFMGRVFLSLEKPQHLSNRDLIRFAHQKIAAVIPAFGIYEMSLIHI